MSQSQAEQKKAGVGRPSKYSPAYCDEVIASGAEGLSLTAFAGVIGVDRSTINEWMAVHPEFSQACKKAQAKRTLYLERGMLSPDASGPMVTARRFALANAAPDEWREKQAVELSGNVTISHEDALAALDRD